MNIPSAYASRRNLANAYRRGFQAGTIADVGGVPLAPYEKLRSVQAYNDGFNAGQDAKDLPASPRAQDGADAFAYGLATSVVGVDLASGTDRTVLSFVCRPPHTLTDLLAFLDQLRKDIDAVLLGGVR